MYSLCRGWESQHATRRWGDGDRLPSRSSYIHICILVRPHDRTPEVACPLSRSVRELVGLWFPGRTLVRGARLVFKVSTSDAVGLGGRRVISAPPEWCPLPYAFKFGREFGIRKPLDDVVLQLVSNEAFQLQRQGSRLMRSSDKRALSGPLNIAVDQDLHPSLP